MDFNLILLFAGLGLLALVALCALLGYFAGLKRELTCIAVFIVLLVLTWLVFGDAATLLNAKFGQSVANMLGINDSSIVTLWDAIVAYAKTIIPNGESLLVEGKETYTLFLSIVSTVFRAVGLLVGTVAILIISPIIRFITFIVRLIIKKVKANKAKAKEEAVAVETVETEETPAEENVEVVEMKEETANEQVVEAAEVEEQDDEEQIVVDNEGDDEEAIITTDENEVKKGNNKRRLLGAVAGAVKGLFVAILVCVPLSGLSSILDTASDDTQALLSDLVNGKAEIKVSETTDPVEMAFDFAEAYDNSALGKFDGISAFFFKESFSEKLFEQMLKMELADEKIYLSDEIKVFIEAANALEGNVDFTSMSKEEFAAVLNALKDSKLIAKLMPVIIEYAAEMDSIKELLGDENVAFLDLRYIDWKHDIDLVLDAVIEAYDLGLFPISELNVLTLNAEELRDVVEILGQAELMNEAYPLIVKVALKLEALQKLIGDISEEVYVDDLKIAEELNALVDIYAKFQELGITSLENLDANVLIQDILTDDAKLDHVLGMVKDVLDLQVAQAIAVPAVVGFVANNENLAGMLEDAGKLEDFKALQYYMTLEDVKGYLDVAKLALDLVDLSAYPEIKFDAFNLNPDKLTEIIDELFNVSVTTDLFAIFSEVAINLDAVKNLLGDALEEVTLEGVDWEAELKLFVEIYSEFLKFGFESADDFKQDMVQLVKDIVNDEAKFEALANVLNKLIDAQVYSKVVAPIIQHFLDKTLVDADFSEFEGILNVEDLTNEEWHEDVETILDILENVNDLGIFDNLNPFDFNQLDITSEEGNALLKELISNIFDLNILGDDTAKTDILLATIEKFEWTTLSSDFDKASINWENEETVILKLVDLLKEIDALEKFDIHDLANTNWVELLEDEDAIFTDYLISVLETLVESNIFIEVLPGVIDKYVLPKLELGEDFDDTELFKDILDKFGDNSQGSKELVDEIIKLIDIVKAAIELNLLGAKDEGLGAIDLANTEALKTIVNGIFESKFLEGNEGRIIRIILKLAKVLDIPMGSDLYNELVSIDYTGEKEMLIAFIEALEPVLQDEDFSVVNEEGKLNLDVNFWTKDESAKALLNALDVLFGAYEDEDAEGSKLAAALLPSLYDKYVEEAGLIPTDYQEVVDILGVTDADGKSLMHDVSCLTYIVDKLVELKALNLVTGDDFNITSEKATNVICEILDVLYDINLFKGNETEFVQWVADFALGKLNLSVDLTEALDSISSEDWVDQKEDFKAIIAQVTSLLRNDYGNPDTEYHINTYNDLLDFIKNKVYATEQFIQPHVVDQITDLLDDLVDIKLFKVVIPEVVKYAIDMLEEKGIDLSYAYQINAEGKRFNEYIIDDLHALFAIVDYAALELNVCEYVNNEFKGDLELPAVEKVQALVDMIYDLNILSEANGEFANTVLNKVFEILDEKGDIIISVDDLLVYTIDWEKEVEFVKEVIALAYDLLDAMNVYTLDDIRTAINEKYYTDINMIRDEVFSVASDALRVLAKSQLVANALPKLYNYGIFKLADGSLVKLPFAVEYLKDISKEALLEDLNTLADIVDDLVEFGIADIIKDMNVKDINLELAAQIVEKLYSLNIINDRAEELFYNAYNYLLGLAGEKLNLSVSAEQIASIDFEQEFVTLANVVRSLIGVLEAKDITDLEGLLNIVKEKEYANKEFYTEEAFQALVDVVIAATDLQLIDLVTPQLIDYVVDLAGDKGFDVSFLNDNVYENLVVEDLVTILEYVKENGHAAGLIDLAFDKTLDPMVTEALVNILDFLPATNLMKEYSSEVFELAASKLYSALGIDAPVDGKFDTLNVQKEIDTLQEVLLIAANILNTKDINGLDAIKSYVNGKFYLQKDVLDGIHEDVQALVNKVLDLQLVELTIVDIFNHYITSVKFADFDTLKDAFTPAELISDIRSVVAALDEIVDAKVIGLVFGESIEDLEINLDAYKALLNEIKDINILNKHWDRIAAAVVNMALDALSPAVDAKAIDYNNISFTSELAIIIDAFPEIDAVIQALTGKEVNTVGDVLNAVKEIKVNAEIVDLVDAGIDLVEKLIKLETLQNSLDELVNAAADKFDVIGFLADDSNEADLLSDVESVLAIARIAVDEGILEAALTDPKSVELDFAVIEEILTIVKGINILSTNWDVLAALAVNAGLKALSDEVTVDKSEYKYISSVSELNIIINALPEVEELVTLLTGKSVATVDEVLKSFSNVKVTAEMIEVGLNLADELVEIKTLQNSLGELVAAAADKYEVIEFLSDDADDKVLLSDIKAILKAARILLDAKVIEYALANDILNLELDFDAYEEALTVLKGVSIIDNNWEKIANILVNFLLNKLGSSVEVEYVKKNIKPAYRAEIAYADDMDAIIALLNEVEDITITFGNAKTINELISNIKNVKNLGLDYRTAAEELVDVLEAFVAIEILRPAYEGFGEIVGNKVTDLAFLFEAVSSDEIESDIRSLIDILHSVLDYGTIEFIFKDGEIDVTSEGAAVINNAIDTIFNLNIVTGSEEQLFEFVLSKVGANVDLAEFVWYEEVSDLQKLISSVYVVLENNSLNSIPAIKEFFKGIKVVDFLKANETALVDVLHALVESKIAMVALPFGISFALKAVANGEYAYLIENVTTDELVEDVFTLVAIVDAVVESDVLSVVYGDEKAMELELDFDSYIAILEGLANLNIVDNSWQNLGPVVANILTKKFGAEELTTEDFEGISYEADINNLVEVVTIAKEICEHFDINCAAEYNKLLKEFNEKDVKLLNSIIVQQVVDILDLVNGVETLQLLYPALTNKLDEVLVNKGLDLGFVFEGQTSETLTEDIDSIVEMLNQLIEFGVIEFAVMDGELSYDDLSAITNILETLFGLNLVKGNEQELIEFALDKAVINKEAVEFDLITDWSEEVDSLNDIIVAAIAILDEKGLTSMDNIYEMLYVKAYLDKDFYDETLGELAQNLIVQVAESNLIISLLPAIIDKALANISISGIEFLSELTAEQIASDIIDLAGVIPAVIKTNIIPVALGGNVKDLELNFDAFSEIVACFENMNILNKGWANIVEIALNLVLNKVGSDYVTIAAEYEGIVFYDEVQKIKAVLEALETLCNDLGVERVGDLTDVLKNITDLNILNRRNLNDVVEVLEAIINIETLQNALPSVGAIATAVLGNKGLDIAFLFEGQTSETLTEDINSIISMVDTLVQSGLVEFFFMDQKYDLNNLEPVQNIIETIAGLNMLDGNAAPLLKLVLGKLGVDLTNVDLESIDYGKEEQLVSELLVRIVNIALYTNCDYITDIYEINLKDFLLPTERTNEFIQNFADIFDILSQSKVIEALVLPVSAKFLAKPGNMAGLIDLHNIYNEGSEFSSDLAAIRDVLLGLKELDVFGFLHGFVKFPFDKNETVNEMITALFTMNYLNLGEGRFDEIAKAVGNLVKFDLSAYDFSKVDLAADAPKLCAMVDELSLVLTDENWLVVDITTINPFEVKKDFLTDYEVIENTLDALSHLVSTTLYTEVGGLAILAFPAIEKAAPDFYNALGLYDTDFAEMKHEIAVLGNIITELGKLEVVEMHKTYDFFTKDFRDIIVNVLNGIDESSILSDHINDLVQVIVEKFVYGKKIAGLTLGYDFLDIASIDFAGDKDRLIAIIDELYTLILKETYGEFSGDVYEDFIDEMERYSFAYGLHDLNDYIYSMTKNLYAYFEFEYRYVCFENIIDYVLNCSLLQTNGLAIMNNFVTPLMKGDMAELLDFSQFTNEEFASDLSSIVTFVKQVRELGLYAVIRDEELNYDQADLVKEFFANIAELNYFDHNLFALIDFVEGKGVVPFSIVGLKSADFDIEHDIKVFGEIYELLVPILTSDAYVFTKRTIYEDFIKNNHKFITSLHDVCYEYKYNLVEVYEQIVSITAIPLIFQDAMEYIKTKTPDKVDNIIDAMGIDSLTPAQIKEDLYVTADMLRTLVDMNIDKVFKERDLFWYYPVYSTLTGTPVACETIDLIKLLIDQTHSLNLLNNRADILVAILEALDVDTTNIDLSTISEADWDNEVEILKTIIDELAKALDGYGIHSYGELAHYCTNVLGKLNNKEAIIAEIQAMYNMINFEHLGNIFTALGDSKVLDEIFTPTYMALAHSKVPADMSALLDLTDYTGAFLDEDLDYLATICYSVATVRNVEVELGNELKDNVEDSIVINATADAIRSLLSLNVLTLKKADLVAFIDTKVSADLSGINTDNIDLKADANLFADLADHMLYIIGATNYLEDWKEYYHLGDTKLMTNVVELYKGVIETSTVVELSHWAKDEYGTKLESFIPEFGTYENAEVDLLLDNLAVTLQAMLEMGVFSNTAIDFTDASITDRFFVVFEQIYAEKDNIMEHIAKIKEHAELLGIIPINYADIVTEDENEAISAFKSVVSEFLDNYKDSLSNNFVSLADPECQIDIVNGFATGFASKLFAQLGVPVLNGLIKIYTVEKVQLNILDGFDNDSFINQFLPDIFNVIDALYPIGALEKRFDYNDADALINLADALIFNDTTVPHLSDITKYLLTYAEVDVTSMDLSAVVWEDEYAYIEGALTALKTPLATLDLGELSSFQNNEFLVAASVACTYLENSNLVAGIGRYALDTLVEKVFGNAYDEFRDQLFASTYNDQLFLEDFGKLDEIFVNVAASNAFNGGLVYANLDPVVEVIEILLNLNYANGIEGLLVEKAFSFVEIIAEYEIDYTLVTDWSVEKVELVDVLEAMSDLFKLVDFDNVTESDLNNTAIQNRFVDLVDECSESVIGQQLLPAVYDAKIKPLLGADYQEIIDFTDPNFTPDMWAKEFEKAFALNDALVEIGYNTIPDATLEEAIEIMALLFGPSIIDYELGIYTATRDEAAYEAWIDRLVAHDLIKVGDDYTYSKAAVEAEIALGTYTWKEETYKVMDLMKDLTPFVNAQEKFQLDVLFASNDSVSINAALTEMSEVIGLRGNLYKVVQDAPTVVSTALNADPAYAEELAKWLADETYYGEFWTEANIEDVAGKIAAA